MNRNCGVALIFILQNTNRTRQIAACKRTLDHLQVSEASALMAIYWTYVHAPVRRLSKRGRNKADRDTMCACRLTTSTRMYFIPEDKHVLQVS